MYKPTGILPAMVTPMHKDGSIDEESLCAQVRRHHQSGVHGIFVLGTNGEFYALQEEEKIRVMELTVKENAHKLPICAGIGCITTAQTISLAHKAQEIGVDALSVITPYFGMVSQKALTAHYLSVARNTDLPIILYNIPARTGVSISYQTLEALAKEPNIVAIKDSSGNFDNTLRYLECTDHQFHVLAGNDSLILSTLMAGGKGAIAATANLFPHQVSQIYESFQSGDIARATQIQNGLRAIRDCFALGNPNTVIKYTTNLLGHGVGPVREPFQGDSETWAAVIGKVLETNYSDWC
ncbi:MAG: 4-hydroxy-tetrahydrodipicolinate synthase [Clostridia bacterium]